tara:strand:- start:1087 stop:1506 length:420 start_codon:yes stop_codon:yes gene_type:complete
MAFYRGQQGTVKFDKDASGGTSEIAAIRSWSASLTKESLSVDAHGDTSHAFIGGMLGGSGSIEVLYDAPSSGDKLDLIKEVITTTDPANAFAELYLDESGGKKIEGSILVTGAEYGASVGELETVSVSFTFNGAPTLAV